MASLTAAIAFGPINYVVPGGQQYLIPVAAFGFNAASQIEFVEGGAAPYPSGALLWLEQLRQWGYIRPSTKPAKALAMVIEAADPGVLSNHIEVTFSKSGNLLNMKVESTATYSGTVAELKALLGTETQPGTQPGLVRFRDQDLSTTPPLLPLPEPIINAPFTGGVNGEVLPVPSTTVDRIKKASDPLEVAFRLVARKPGSGGDHITITISAAQSVVTFSVKWTHQPPAFDLSAPDILTAINTQFGYMISVSAPPGQTFAEPDVGTILLAGGTDAAKASARPVTP